MDIQSLQNADLTELVFRNRNKDYGAYLLRRKYNKTMTRALIAACMLFLLALGFPVIAKKMGWFEKGPEDDMVVTQVELVDPPPLDENKPEPPKVEPPPPVKETVQFVAPEIKKDEDVKEEEEDPIKIIDSLKVDDAQVSVKSQEGDANAEPEVGIIEGSAEEKVDVVEKPVVEEPKIFTFVEQNPEFPGGSEALLKYLSSNIKYPRQAVDNNIEGKVMLTFVVNEDGDITDIKVLRGLGAGCDEEAIRVIKSMPKWNPGKQQGKAVKVQFNLPVKFVLQ